MPDYDDNPVIRLAGLVHESITDGPGLRLAVFVQGCPHNCPGCHNPETHDPRGGRDITVLEIVRIYDDNPLLSGVTLSGGEPFEQAAALVPLARAIRERGGNVISYSGYTYEQLLKRAKADPTITDLLRISDWLIDGPFVQALRDLTLLFRGSSNQRILKLEPDGVGIVSQGSFEN